ncbi:hypothetical protein QVD17_14242 [Tagetes erecta]|uniref:C2H2-type domain-containing protein n=1 Tax=Tagetes erecta TaxID=13708 RepID=A0AAD8P3V1_TARER|nr:hypothetical protein QVD17_14242 [Tagetes erecta]
MATKNATLVNPVTINAAAITNTAAKRLKIIFGKHESQDDVPSASTTTALKPLKKLKKPKNHNVVTSTNRPKHSATPKKTKNDQKHHPEANLDVHLGFINTEGKLVCRLCQDNFVSMKYLYYHLRDDHSYDDMKMFFASTNACNVQVHSTKVVDKCEVYDQELNEAAETLMLIANCFHSMADKEVNANHVVEDLSEPGKTLTLFGDHHQWSTGESSMKHKEVEESLEELKDVANGVGSKVVHAFDLNVVPDLEEDDDHHQ